MYSVNLVFRKKHMPSQKQNWLTTLVNAGFCLSLHPIFPIHIYLQNLTNKIKSHEFLQVHQKHGGVSANQSFIANVN